VADLAEVCPRTLFKAVKEAADVPHNLLFSAFRTGSREHRHVKRIFLHRRVIARTHEIFNVAECNGVKCIRHREARYGGQTGFGGICAGTEDEHVADAEREEVRRAIAWLRLALFAEVLARLYLVALGRVQK
jgi:hypothetical protein